MKKIYSIIIILLNFLISLNIYSATEVKREGICGDPIAQPGPDPAFEPSENTCYVKIYYDDGTEGELKLAVWEPATELGYGDVRSVDVWAKPNGMGIYYRINLFPYSSIFFAPTEDFVHYWIANLP